MEQMTIDDYRRSCRRPGLRLIAEAVADLCTALLALDELSRDGDSPSVIPHEVRERLMAYLEVPRV